MSTRKVFIGGVALGGRRTLAAWLHPKRPPPQRTLEAGWTLQRGDLQLDFKTAQLGPRIYDLIESTEPAIQAEAAFVRTADVFVWVWDSQSVFFERNQAAIARFLSEVRRLRDADLAPMIIAANKRDLSDISSMDVIRQTKCWNRQVFVPTIARDGIGVVEVLNEIEKHR